MFLGHAQFQQNVGTVKDIILNALKFDAVSTKSTTKGLEHGGTWVKLLDSNILHIAFSLASDICNHRTFLTYWPNKAVRARLKYERQNLR